MTTALTEIREHADLFGWNVHPEHQSDTLINSGHMIAVRYGRDGSVANGQLYEFRKVTEPVLKDSAPRRRGRSTVVAWLVEFGH